MAIRTKQSKVQKRAKRRGNSAKRGKPRKVAKRAAAKRAKPKPRPEKKAARRTIAPVVETVVVDVIEQPAPGVISVTEVEEARQVN